MSVNLRSLIVVSLMFIFTINPIEAQVDANNISTEDVESLSDQKLFGYYQKIKSQGYSDEQIKTLARARGVSVSKISEFES
ncbi:MAG: hypothetical protein ACI849_001858, partial [Patiriisocius sp.]